MTFTLKIQCTNMRNSKKPGFMWFPGVQQVSLIDYDTKQHALLGWTGDEGSHCPPVWLSYGATDYTSVPPDAEIALLWVVFEPQITSVSEAVEMRHATPQNDRYMIVERAWLLGANGETIDRIWP